jgi:hypothetical protein
VLTISAGEHVCACMCRSVAKVAALVERSVVTELAAAFLGNVFTATSRELVAFLGDVASGPDDGGSDVGEALNPGIGLDASYARQRRAPVGKPAAFLNPACPDDAFDDEQCAIPPVHVHSFSGR